MAETTIALYQVDAFTSKTFGGNPAAICPLDRWLKDDLLQSIAAGDIGCAGSRRRLKSTCAGMPLWPPRT
jgi:hypothetical protein